MGATQQPNILNLLIEQVSAGIDERIVGVISCHDSVVAWKSLVLEPDLAVRSITVGCGRNCEYLLKLFDIHRVCHSQGAVVIQSVS